MVKYDLDGTALWTWKPEQSTSFGSIYMVGVVARPDGGVSVAAGLSGTFDLDPDPDAELLAVTGSGGIAVVDLASDGAPTQATVIGRPVDGSSSLSVLPLGFAGDDRGNRYVGGYLSGQGSFDFDPAGGTPDTSRVPSAFLASYNAQVAYRWSFVIGKEKLFSTQQIRAFGVAADDQGVYLTGFFTGTHDFDPGPGVRSLTVPGTNSLAQGFAARYAPADGSLIWAQMFGNDEPDKGQAIVGDGLGGAFVAGAYTDTMRVSDRRFAIREIGKLFVARFGEMGRPLWTLVTGDTIGVEGSDGDTDYGIAYDGAGRVAVGGQFFSEQTFGGTRTFSQPSGGGFRSGEAQAFIALFARLRELLSAPLPSATPTSASRVAETATTGPKACARSPSHLAAMS